MNKRKAQTAEIARLEQVVRRREAKLQAARDAGAQKFDITRLSGRVQRAQDNLAHARKMAA